MSSFEYHPNRFPIEYTNKIIVAQWPCVDKRINHEENKHMYTYVNLNDFLHDNLINYDGNTRAFDYNNSDSWASQFITQVVDIANDNRTESPYILIDGLLEVVEILEARNMNFILVVSESLDRDRELLNIYLDGGQLPNYTYNRRAHAAMWHFMCMKSFRVIHTNELFTNYLFNNIGIIDQATNRAMNILLNHNDLINKDNRIMIMNISIIYEENEECNDLTQFTSHFNDKELVREAEKMIKDANYIAFESKPDHDICDYEEEYPESSDCEDCYDD